MTQLAPSKVLKINILNLTPVEQYGQEPNPNQPWRFSANLTIVPQLHSDPRTPRPGVYNGYDVVVGDYILSRTSRVLRIIQVNYQDDDQVTCVLEDHKRLNSSVDVTQSGESSIETGQGLLFTLASGLPVLFPLPGDLGNLSFESLVEVLGRFVYSEGFALINMNDLDISNLQQGSILTYSTSTETWNATSLNSTTFSISSGTISLKTIGTSLGGTGITSYTTGDILYALSSSTLVTLSKPSTFSFLTMDNNGTPSWANTVDGGTY
jgi:hypothetical protein